MATALHLRTVLRLVLMLAAGLLPISRAVSQAPAPPRLPPDPAQAAMLDEATDAVRLNKLARINGVPYDQPSGADTLHDYVRDTYGIPAVIRTVIRAIYAEGLDKPAQWSEGFGGFSKRIGSAAGITIINGNVRYGMELAFHEDLRYLPCYGCSKKARLENALLAEITARHAENGHRFFTLTPTVADFSGPVLAHSLWYPGGPDPLQGLVSARLVFATRIGGHLFEEFVWSRVHPGLKPQN